MKNSSFLGRLERLALFCLCATVLLLLFSRFYRCPLYALTGIPCPGCGMTRALSCALRMDWRRAFDWNPSIYPFALFCLCAVAFYLSGRTRLAASHRFWGIAAGVLLAVWLVRLPSIIAGDSLLYIRPGSPGSFIISFFLQ